MATLQPTGEPDALEGETSGKKYQVFISSTYKDLVDERQDAIKHVLDIDHLPIGMELFPAAGKKQFSYITRVIDMCDYYLLIIGRRYGSEDEQGTSFTEREFRHAVARNITVVAFIRREVADRTGSTGQGAADSKFERFIDDVGRQEFVAFWRDRNDLRRQVRKLLARAMNEKPAIGWIRSI